MNDFKKENTQSHLNEEEHLTTIKDANEVLSVSNTTTENTPVEEENFGGSTYTERWFANSVDVFTGGHLLKIPLMTFFGGRNLTLFAEYDSSKTRCGSLGKGWHHNFEKSVELRDGVMYVYDNPTVYCVYTPDGDNVYRCPLPGKSGYVLTIDNVNHQYILDCNGERTEYYHPNGWLTKIADHHGFEIVLGSNGGDAAAITDSTTGRKIYLSHNSAGLLDHIYDDNSGDDKREVFLSYDDYNCLTSICDVNGNTLTFTYTTDGRILTCTDGERNCIFTNTYNAAQLIGSQKDGLTGSTAALVTYQAGSNLYGRTTTDRNGKQSIRLFTETGLLTEYTDENGNTKTYEYDAEYNITKETDDLGKSVLMEYSTRNKPTKITDKNGNVTNFEYDTAGNVTKITYPTVNDVTAEESFEYNARNQLTKHTDLRGTDTVYTYDTNGMPLTRKVGSKPAVQYNYQNGLLMSETDARGETTTYEYNAWGLVSKKTDAAGYETLYEYDKMGHLLKTTYDDNTTKQTIYYKNYLKYVEVDANDNDTGYYYNGNGKVTTVIHADGTATEYAYDGEDRLLRITDHGGNATVMTYDDGGRLTKKTLPDGGEITYTYDACGNVLTETDPLGNVVAKTYDNMGNVLTVTDPAGNVTSYQYDARGRVSRVTNAMSGVTTYTYSAAGDLLSETTSSDSETAPFVHTKTYTYDAFGNRVTATDAKGNTTTYAYDANNNLIRVTDAQSHVTTYDYNSLNQLNRVNDAEGHSTVYFYDAHGRQTKLVDGRQNMFETQRDGNGNVIKVIDPYNKVLTETTYDEMNRPLTVKDGVGNTTTYTYTYHGKVETVTDPLNQVKEFTYNSRGMNTAVTDAADGTSTNTYDLSGNVTRLQGPLGGGTNYEYTYGRLRQETTVSNGYVSYAYNALNLPWVITNARGRSTIMTYDAKGRLIAKTSPESTVGYEYDANDHITAVTEAGTSIIREYDSLNRLTRRTDSVGNTVAYTYDKCGHIDSIRYPDNTVVSYGYDNNYNLTSVTDWANRVTTYTYDNNNRLTGVTKPNGCVTTTVYDDAGRVTSSVERSGVGAIVVGYEYTYDANSRVVEEKDLAKSIKLCYTYDVLNRVTKRTKKSLTDNTILSEETFTYDAAGNVTNANGETAQYSLNNRIMLFNGSGVGCDLDGNLTSLHFDSGWMDLSYDSKNRLTSAGGHTYTYDAEDVRIRNLCGDVDTTYAYDTNGKLSRLLMKTTNSVTTKYVYGIGLIGEQTGNSFRYYHFDSRGSTVALTGATGIVTDTFEYDTYGKLTSHVGNNNVIFGYNGRDGVVTDANGLLYMRARYYSPEMRRFVNADIIPGGISEAITLNRYAYANGNPVSFVDPFGLEGMSSHHERVGDYYPNSTADEIYLIDQLLSSLAGMSQSTDANSKTQADPTLSLWADDVEGETAKKVYDKLYSESDALKKIENNSQLILEMASKYEVDPVIVGAVIFVEQYYNYDIVDKFTDWVALLGIDTSVGIGQVKLSTAKYLEENGYVPEISLPLNTNDYRKNNYENMIRYYALLNNSTNINYVAAYIKCLEDIWVNDFPQISTTPDIIGSLYNLGHFKVPHSNPQPNWFGEKVEYVYDLIERTLGKETIE